jgi:membrane-associated phospholipid phosphatase
MAFSAVYLRHHYILDVIFGALLAVPFALFGPPLARRLHPLIEERA